jgi:hypothetical protein
VPIQLELVNGIAIEDAHALLLSKFERFAWDWYDGVETHPMRIEPVDFAITIAMNSRATAGRMRDFLLRREAIEEHLRRVPENVVLGPDVEPTVYAAVATLFAEAGQASGTKLAVASKVLHRKRPRLIPMLDSVLVNRHYWPALTALAQTASPPAWFDAAWLKHGDWSDPTMYMRVMAGEIDRNRGPLEALRSSAASFGVPPEISDVRLFEAVLYAHLVSQSVNRGAATGG